MFGRCLLYHVMSTGIMNQVPSFSYYNLRPPMNLFWSALFHY